MTGNTEGGPNGSLVNAEVYFTDNTGNLLAFSFYKSKESNDLYLNFSFGMDDDSSKWYKLKKMKSTSYIQLSQKKLPLKLRFRY